MPVVSHRRFRRSPVRGPPPPGGRRRRRAGGHLRRRGPDPPGRRPGRRRPDRPAADAVRPGPARHRARPPEDAGDPRHPAPHASTTRSCGSSATSTSAWTSRWTSCGEHVDAVIYTYGAALDRHLGHRGRGPARQPRRHRARRLVHRAPRRRPGRGSRRRWPACGRSWWSGSATSPWTSAACSPARAAELEPTDMPQHVLDALAAVAGRGGHRAGPPRPRPGHLHHPGAARARRAGRTRPCWSTRADLELDPGSEERAAADRNVTRNLAVLRGWADHVAEPGRTRLHLRFFGRPVRLLGEDRVTGVEVERTAVDGDGRAMGTGELEVLPADLVVRSVGYRGTAAARAAGRRAHRARCRNEDGRVLRDGRASPRRVRGRVDQARAQRRRRHQQARRPRDRRRAAGRRRRRDAAHRAGRSATWSTELVARGAEPVLLDDWRAIDAAEIALGATRGRARTTLHEREALLAAVRAAAAPADAQAERGQQVAGGRRRRTPRRTGSARPVSGRSRSGSPSGVSATRRRPAGPPARRRRRARGCRCGRCRARRPRTPSATRHRSTAVQPVTRTRRAVAGTSTVPSPGALGTTTVLPGSGRTGMPSRQAPAPSAPSQRRPEERSATSPATGRPPETSAAENAHGGSPAAKLPVPSSGSSTIHGSSSGTGPSGRSSLSTGTPSGAEHLAAATCAASSAATALPSAEVAGSATASPPGWRRGRRGAGTGRPAGRRRRRRDGDTTRPVVAWRIAVAAPRRPRSRRTAACSSGTPARCSDDRLGGAVAGPLPTQQHRLPAPSASSRSTRLDQAPGPARPAAGSAVRPRPAARRPVTAGAQLRVSHCCAGRSRCR